MERSTIFNGKIHYFDWAIFNSYVKLPEGKTYRRIHMLVCSMFSRKRCHTQPIPSPEYSTPLFYGPKYLQIITNTLWLFNIAMENGPFIDALPIKHCDFPWQTVSRNQMVQICYFIPYQTHGFWGPFYMNGGKGLNHSTFTTNSYCQPLSSTINTIHN